MALFRVTVKQKVRTNGIVLDPGMQVEVVTQSFSDPVHTNGGQAVADAFMRIYGVDIKKAGALNGIYLDVKRIGQDMKARCTYCKSEDIEKTFVGYVENTLSGVLSFGIGMVSSSITGHPARTKDIRDGFSYQYKCKKCGETFHIKD